MQDIRKESLGRNHSQLIILPRSQICVGRADRILPGCPQRLIGEGGAGVLGDVPVEVDQRIAADGSFYPLVSEIAENILSPVSAWISQRARLRANRRPTSDVVDKRDRKHPLVRVNCRDLSIEVDLCGGFSS